MNIRSFFLKTHWLASQFGINSIKTWHAIKNLPTYFMQVLIFKSKYQGTFELQPCLGDKSQEGGLTKSEYFWVDLLVAQLIFNANPLKHVDIGSRIDGFVSHVACFREIEVFDIRPISAKIQNITFKQVDAMNLYTNNLISEYCDSLSCLHALEHFGLGRYGDPINVNGYEYGIRSLAHTLKTDGILYLATPIGQERVEFNANRVFNPFKLINIFEISSLSVQEIIIITPYGEIEYIQKNINKLEYLSQLRYNLGLFILQKKNSV